MQDSAAHEAAEHVAAALVRGQHAVADHESHRPQVVADDAERLLVRSLGGLGCERHDGLEEIGVEDRLHVLQDGRHAFQAQAGVDRRLGQRRHGAVGLAVELHEDEVPELEETLAVVGIAVRPAAADPGSAVEPDLRVGPAGAGVARVPVVVLVAVDPVGAHRRCADPDLARPFVCGVDCDPQLLDG